MAKDLQEDKGVIVPPETPTSTVEPKPGLSQKKQPRYWVRLAVFLVPLILSEIMFLHVGRRWNAVIFPVAWVAFFYFQMKRGGWNVFRP
ncbi:hypothetical protein [Candidatus Cryosericum septentrionale]|jgi:hypothetical protein|uniref:Uncharacterized protein n=1 Tax=Candidatus Cryosericum septentrionale TaxID=2290913 RepID=A0A398DN18_9BACT|nr:hypothetical protein [Candidatus Cryosericum septentrionale]RIE16350.1 hypothetical protein SMC1_07415 [Candidatus Cryosericum septentrionale]